MTLGLKPTLVMMDRPEHTTFRRLISRGFTPRKVAELEPAMRVFVRERVGALAEAGEADFVEATGRAAADAGGGHLPGRARGRPDRFDAWSDAIVQANATGNTVARRQRGRGRSVRVLHRAGRAAAQGTRATTCSPTSWPPRSTVGPCHLDEILGYCFVMIAGGNDTASGLLSGSAVALTEHPRPAAAAARRPRVAPGRGGGAAAHDQPGAGPVPDDHPGRGPARDGASGGEQGPPPLRIGQSRPPGVRAHGRRPRCDPAVPRAC